MMFGMSPDMAAMGHGGGGGEGRASNGINVNMSKSVLFRNAQPLQNGGDKGGGGGGSRKMTTTGQNRRKIRYGAYYSSYYDDCEEDEEDGGDDYFLNEDGTDDDLFYQRRKQRQIGRFRVQQEKQQRQKQKQQQQKASLLRAREQQQKKDSTEGGGSGGGILPGGKKFFVRIARLISIKNMLCRNGNGKQSSSTSADCASKCSLSNASSRGNGGKRSSIPAPIIANIDPMPTIVEETDTDLDLTIHRLAHFPTPGSVESIQDSAISSGSGSEGEQFDPTLTTQKEGEIDEDQVNDSIWDQRRYQQVGRERHRVLFRAATSTSNGGSDFYSKWAHEH